MSPQERKQLQLANARERKAIAALARANKKNLQLKEEIENLKKVIEKLQEVEEPEPEPKPKSRSKRQRVSRSKEVVSEETADDSSSE